MRILALVALATGGLLVWPACGGGSVASSTATVPIPTANAQLPAPGSLIFRASGNWTTDSYSADLATGTLTDLSGAPGSANGVPSPNGMLIAFSSKDYGAADISVMHADGTGVRNLTQTPDKDEIFLSWSPVGGKLLFGYFGETSGEYWVMNADGSDSHVVLSRCRDCGISDWSPDGRNLVGYRSDDAARRTELFVVNADDTQLRVLQTMYLSTPNPRWSPDGATIAYVTSGPESALMTTGLSGGEPVQLLAGPRIGQFSWAPSGEELAVPTAGGLVSVDVRSATPRTLVQAESVFDPVWSPDGTRIAYVISTSAQSNVYVVSAAGGTPTNVSNGPWVDSGARWSSDGRSVIFWSDRNSRDGVYSMRPDGSGLRRLFSVNPNGLTSEQIAALPTPHVTNGCAPYLFAETLAYHYSGLACLSPDGSQAAAVLSPKSRPGSSELALVNRATDVPTTLPLSGITPTSSPPAWSPDGKRFAFYGTEGGKTEVFTYDLGNGKVSALAEGNSYANGTPALLWSQDGSYLYYTEGSGCSGGCWAGYLYRVRADGDGEQQLTDLRVETLYGFAP